MPYFDIWDPLEDMTMMRRRMQKMLGPPIEFGLEKGITRAPLIDVIDKGDRYEVVAELPGVDKKDIKINVMPNSVSIGAEQKHRVEEERKEKGAHIYFHERSYQHFFRQIPLAEEIMPDKTTADFKNGILELVLRKKVPAKAAPKGFKVDVK